MDYIIRLFIVLLAFLAMEGVAWTTHKYVMHGFLWRWHRDHHKKETYGFFEKNDYFFLVFAIPGMLGIGYGVQQGFNVFFWIGLGITLYGMTYFLVHDVFIHQRIKWFRRSEWPYFKAIRRAHKIHHKHLDKEDGECFGMLWVPRRYYKASTK